ncbi:MerR family transcriptional regulator [Streptosporangium lutulentum]|uniref:DNA-binding transcriptional MerR regulator n=1 Tax=Streptosporangium lutulentum TaxID=1461250 RepID=A0ABT9QAQ6_9ACTN|nr:MerR family transcriptional regulator [Streptosporangium lutulentum]MDP9843823.1 DNA-binding transcriptional MerR regulator [Streptosporangium lutulentum]
MRIGELAALVGVSTRTVRHYHHLDLLPEPVRLANGYREYRLRDAVALARVRRLAELGLSLDEIRDVLADDRGRELREVLVELDADLARQQEAISLSRDRLAALLAEVDLHPDSTVSPDMAKVLRGLHTEGSKFAEIDRELLALMDTVADPADRARILDMMRPLSEPDALARTALLYRRLDELADADAGDPRVTALAADLAAHVPDEMAAVMVANLDSVPDPLRPPGDGPAESAESTESTDGRRWMETMHAEMSPAQIEVFRLLMISLREKM